MSFRLALLVDSFDFAPLDRQTVFNSVREVLDHALHFQTHLLYNRHADQLVLSALYGFCKVQKLDKVRSGAEEGGWWQGERSIDRRGLVYKYF